MPENYIDKNDSELIDYIKSGDFDAFTEISTRYSWLIKAKAAKFSALSSPECEDLMQEGSLALFLATGSYKPKYKTSFKTYAAICIENQMISLYRRSMAKKNLVLTDSVPFDSLELEGLSHDENPEQIFEIKENIAAFYKKISETLSTLELRVLSLYLSGIERAEIESKTDISLKAFDNALGRVRKKLKKDLE